MSVRGDGVRAEAGPAELPETSGDGADAWNEHVDVLVVGAGLSGVCAGYYLRTQCPWARFTILEARAAIGGTWDLFRFPGIRADSDMFTLGYPFKPWQDEKTMADGTSILRYIRETARTSGIERSIRFHHRVTAAEWSSAAKTWRVTAVRSDTGATVELTAGFLFVCAGYYRYDRGYLPEIPGVDRFRGTVVHPQFWPEDLDYEGKCMVVVGSGATAVTLLPALAERAAHVTMLQRSPSYIASVPDTNPVARLLGRVLPAPLARKATRWLLALMTLAFFAACRRWPERMRTLLVEGVRRQLPEGFDVARHFSPRYNPWDQRLCIVPDGDLFKAISAGRASVVTDRIATFTETGLLLESGRELGADVVVTATGLDLQFVGGMRLSVDGADVDLSQRLVYRGAMLEGLPNFGFVFGYTNASWTLKCDLACHFVVRLLREMRRRGVRQVTPVCVDGSVERGPFLDFSSGYIRRAIDRLPRSGSRPPWRVNQNYLRDFNAMRLEGFADRSLVFSSPVPGAGGAENRSGGARPPATVDGRAGESGGPTRPDTARKTAGETV